MNSRTSAANRASPNSVVGLIQATYRGWLSRTGVTAQPYGPATTANSATTTASGPVHQRSVNRRAAIAVRTTNAANIGRPDRR